VRRCCCARAWGGAGAGGGERGCHARRVCLPHGWGHDRKGIRLGVASRHAGASINDVIDDQFIDALTGTAVLNGTPVDVEAIAAT